MAKNFSLTVAKFGLRQFSPKNSICGNLILKNKNYPYVNPIRTLTQQSEGKILTIREIAKRLQVIVAGEKKFTSDEERIAYVNRVLPKSQKDLPPRFTKDSYCEAIVPLEEDPDLRLLYLTTIGTVRVGRILEDLDLFAVWLSYAHMHNPTLEAGFPVPFNFATALVDAMHLGDFVITANHDLKYTGCVSWVGNSSIETRMKLFQQTEGKWEFVAIAYYVMVARDIIKRKAAFVNSLVPETEEEKKMLEDGNENSARRKESAGKSLLMAPPSEMERQEIHNVYLSTLDSKDQSYNPRILPPNSAWMEKCQMSTTILCQPEDRNRSDKIFGGYIMRQAVELAFNVAYAHCRSRPSIQHLDDIWFREPVDIGSILCFTAQIVYVKQPFIQVRVEADVLDPETSNRTMTNLFHFSLKAAGNIPQVVPKTYGEAMMYLDGKRHLDLNKGS